MTAQSKRPVAFVLSGGASHGAVQAGMLRALYEHGVTPDLIVGTSAGALNGAFIASRPQSVATARQLSSVWRSLHRSQVFPLNPIIGLLGFLGKSDHLVPDRELKALITEHAQVERLEEMPIPLHVVAVDIVSGEEVLLSDGSTVQAVLASSSVPAILPPVKWNGRELVDGGIANNAPISHAIELGAHDIYVLPTGHACGLQAAPSGALEMAIHAISLLTHRRLIQDIARHRGHSNLVVLPPPCPLTISPVDFSQADELIRRSYEDATHYLDSHKKSDPPIQMHMHSHLRDPA